MPHASLWTPRIKLTKQEELVCRKLVRTGRFFAFLRQHRRQIFDDAFQAELMGMYAAGEAGRPPVPPALLAMVTLLQAYLGRSDAGAVQDSVLDLRWQMVLDCLGEREAPFSQGVLVSFRERMIAHDLDKRLIARTVEVAEQTGDFGHKALRVALDSAPLWGSGRGEDTSNLIAHAMRLVARGAARAAEMTVQDVLSASDVTLLSGKSVKAALDIDWSDEEQRHEALQRLLTEMKRLEDWVEQRFPSQPEYASEPVLNKARATLTVVGRQDVEPDKARGGMRIREGVAKDRRISIEDADMRHGRKSKSRLFNGYKRHILRNLDTKLIYDGVVRPANEPEAEAPEAMKPTVEPQEVHIDRAFLRSEWIRTLRARGCRIVVKAPAPHNRGLFSKARFRIDLEQKVVTCPAQQAVPLSDSGTARFKGEMCDGCALRSQCTRAKAGSGRTIKVHEDEAFHQELRARVATKEGRAELRQRTDIEHGLAHVVRRQGQRARYRGTRKNLFDLRRVCAVENLLTIDHRSRMAA